MILKNARGISIVFFRKTRPCRVSRRYLKCCRRCSAMVLGKPSTTEPWKMQRTIDLEELPTPFQVSIGLTIIVVTSSGTNTSRT